MLHAKELGVQSPIHSRGRSQQLPCSAPSASHTGPKPGYSPGNPVGTWQRKQPQRDHTFFRTQLKDAMPRKICLKERDHRPISKNPKSQIKPDLWKMGIFIFYFIYLFFFLENMYLFARHSGSEQKQRETFSSAGLSCKCLQHPNLGRVTASSRRLQVGARAPALEPPCYVSRHTSRKPAGKQRSWDSNLCSDMVASIVSRGWPNSCITMPGLEDVTHLSLDSLPLNQLCFYVTEQAMERAVCKQTS